MGCLIEVSGYQRHFKGFQGISGGISGLIGNFRDFESVSVVFKRVAGKFPARSRGLRRRGLRSVLRDFRGDLEVQIVSRNFKRFREHLMSSQGA